MDICGSMIRCFFAFDIPGFVVDRLIGLRKEITAHGFKIKRVAPDNIHITVRFLGELSPDEARSACDAARESVKTACPMTLAVRGVGVFPDPARPRVLWAGLSGDIRSLVDFHRVLEDNLCSAGFEREQRRFRAHVTLGRMKKGSVDPGKLARVMERYVDFQTGSFCIDRLGMYKSQLNASGPVCTRLAALDFSSEP